MDSIHVRYINLDRRTDRNEDIINKLVGVLGFDKKNIKRFSAIDGTNLSQDLRNKNYLDDELVKIIMERKSNVRIPELACLLSHYFLLKEIVKDETIPDKAIIFLFEDDFFINTPYLETNKFSDIINEINKFNEFNWDMIYLGGRFAQNFIPVNKSFFKQIKGNLYLRVQGKGIDWDRTAHNYLIKKSNIQNILNCYINYFKNNIKLTFQVDTFYNLIPNHIKMYDYFPHIFYSPRNYTSDIQYSRLVMNTKDII